jgi:DNA helicase HerA-like ATPase
MFLEEARKFLDPAVSEFTIFSILVREMPKFNLILSLVDQRPSRIDDEVMSQLAIESFFH